MKLCKTAYLKGGEVLAKPIITSEYRILLSDGITLRPEYISKIEELGITEVYIKEEHISQQAASILKTDVENIFHSKVKHIIERHTYNNNEQLMELSQTADNIITSVLEEEEVVDRVFDIKERSADIYEHSVNICSYATLLALRLKLSKESVHDIAVGCLLHDLGLRYFANDYDNRSADSFSKSELTEYRKHPIYGYTAIKDETWISELGKKIILHHHEKIDGSGYPLKIRDIPYEVQIVSVCDTFDEMICGIGYERQKVYKAVEYLKSLRGFSFAAPVVDVFLEFTAVYPVGSKVLLSDGSIGNVIRQNKEFPERPVIQITNADTENSSEESIVDLLKTKHIFVEKVLE